jgi:hypothetical protein
MAESNGSRVLQYLPIVDQEVRRRMALGVPRGVDRSDVRGEAEEALVVAAVGARSGEFCGRPAMQPPGALFDAREETA